MGYNQDANTAAKKYKSTKQKQIAISYKIDEYELDILPAIQRTGLPVATFIKEAIREKIDSGSTESLTLADVISYIKKATAREIPKVMADDCQKIILYGSCARGDFTENSDVDIAILTACDRIESQKYNKQLDNIATDLGIKTTALVNFVCLPYAEFEEKKSWYPYFKNIDREGVLLYECG